MQEALCFAAGFGFLILLLAGSLTLRGAVAISNRLAGPPKPDAPEDPFADWDWDGEAEDERARRTPERAIPEPGFGKGMMITSTVGVLAVLFGVLVALALEALDFDLDRDDESTAVMLTAFTLPLSFLGTAVLLTAMLPTTFGRAALVSFVYHAIGAGIAVGLIVLIAAAR